LAQAAVLPRLFAIAAGQPSGSAQDGVELASRKGPQQYDVAELA